MHPWCVPFAAQSARDLTRRASDLSPERAHILGNFSTRDASASTNARERKSEPTSYCRTANINPQPRTSPPPPPTPHPHTAAHTNLAMLELHIHSQNVMIIIVSERACGARVRARMHTPRERTAYSPRTCAHPHRRSLVWVRGLLSTPTSNKRDARLSLLLLLRLPPQPLPSRGPAALRRPPTMTRGVDGMGAAVAAHQPTL